MEYLIIDTESCTGKTDDGSLCSFGYVISDENLNVIKREDIIFNPLPKRFFVGDKKNFKRTGIFFAYTKNQFRAAKRFSEEYEKIKNLFKNRTVLGFSMSNDIKYLNDACNKYNLPLIEYEFYDIQYVYKLLFPAQTATGLKTLCEKYNNEFLAHRSDEDALASLNLLKSVLHSENLTFQSGIDKYGVKCGKNLSDGYYLNYSDAVIKRQFGLKITRKASNAVYADFLKKLPQKKNKPKVAFSHKLEKEDIDYLRTLILLIYNNDMSFTHEFDKCKILVLGEDDTPPFSLRKDCEIMSRKKFEKYIGYTNNQTFDDEIFLKKFFTEKIK